MWTKVDLSVAPTVADIIQRPTCTQTAANHGLHTVEQVLWHQRFEITTPRANTVLGNVHDPGVEAIARQHADRL